MNDNIEIVNMARETMPEFLRTLKTSGSYFSIVYINSINSHDDDWKELAQALAISTLLANHKIAVANGTVSSKAKDAIPYAKESRSLVLRDGKFGEMIPETDNDPVPFEDQITAIDKKGKFAGYFNALDLAKAKLYLAHNREIGTAPHTDEDCAEYCKSQGLVYARDYFNKETQTHHPKGTARITACVCQSLPLRRFSMAGVVQLTTQGTIYRFR